MTGHAITHHGRTDKLSRAVTCNGMAWLSGITAPDKRAGTGDQVRQVLERADSVLADIGSGRDRLVYVQIWLRDIDEFDEMNAIWLDWIGTAAPPARATVEARFALPEIAVEMQFVAAAP